MVSVRQQQQRAARTDANHARAGAGARVRTCERGGRSALPRRAEGLPVHDHVGQPLPVSGHSWRTFELYLDEYQPAVAYPSYSAAHQVYTAALEVQVRPALAVDARTRAHTHAHTHIPTHTHTHSHTHTRTHAPYNG